MITPILLTSHIVLFGIKAWAITLFLKKFKYPYMLLWSIIYLFVEACFLHNFFVSIDLYYYEIISIIDQSIFTIGLVFYLTKGE